MSPVLAGALLGFVAACGVLIAVLGSPPMRSIRLDDRLSPYLRDSPPPSRLLAGGTAPIVGVLAPVRHVLRPVLADLTRWVDRLVGGRGSVRRRLAALGNRSSVEDSGSSRCCGGRSGSDSASS